MVIDGAAYVVDLARPEALQKESVPAETAPERRPARRVRSFDRVEISSQGRELTRLKREMAALPDVRLDRVALARQTMQNGGYRVAATDLAQKMIDAFGTR